MPRDTQAERVDPSINLGTPQATPTVSARRGQRMNARFRARNPGAIEVPLGSTSEYGREVIASTKPSSSSYLQADSQAVQLLNQHQMISGLAKYMPDDVMASIQHWAQAQPTLNPRVWMPLAMVAQRPDSDIGKALILQAQQNDAGDGIDFSGDGSAGQTAVKPDAQTAVSQVQQADADAVASGTASPSVMASYSHFGVGSLASGAGGFLSGVWDSTVSDVGAASRATMGLLGTPVDLLWSGPRVLGGVGANEDDIADQFALSGQERDLAFSNFAQAPDRANYTDDSEGGVIPRVLDAIGLGTDPDLRYQSDLKSHEANEAAIAALPPDAQQRIRDAQAAMANYSQTVGDEFWKQTPAGAMAASGGIWNPDDTGLLPSPEVNEIQSQAGGKIWDVRTAKDRADAQAQAQQIRLQEDAWAAKHGGLSPEQSDYYESKIDAVLAPKGWTLGRGTVTALGGDMESADAQFWSGAVDLVTNLVSDPVNLIPIGKAGTLAKVSRSGSDAAEDLLRGVDGARSLGYTLRHPGPGAIVRAPNTQFAKAGEEGARPAASMASRDARSAVAKAEAKTRGGKEFRLGNMKIDDETGLVKTPHSMFVIPQRVAEFLVTHPRGQEMVKRFTEIEDPAEIRLRSNGKISIETARRLADTRTMEQTIAVLGDRLGTEITDANQLGSLRPRSAWDVSGLVQRSADRITGGTVGGTAFSDARGRRLFRRAPHSVLDLRDPEGSFDNMVAYGRSVGMKYPQMKKALNTLANANDGIGRYEAVYGKDGFLDAMKSHLISEYGLAADDAEALTRGIRSSTPSNFVNSYTHDLSGKTDGNGYASYLDEILGDTAPLPDPRDLRVAVNQISSLRKMALGQRVKMDQGEIAGLINGTARNLAHATTTAWRNATLIRAAYPIRNLLDIWGRAALAGYDSPFTKPWAFAANVHRTTMAYELQSSLGRALDAVLNGQQNAADLMREYVAFRTGIEAFKPTVREDMLGINGKPLLDAVNRARRGEDVDWTPLFRGTLGGRANTVMDETRRAGAANAQQYSLVNAAHAKPYQRAVRETLVDLSMNPIHQRLARGESPASIKRWLKESGTWEEMKRMDRVADRPQRSMTAILKNAQDEIRTFTSGDDDLVSAIATGKYDGEDILHSQALSNRLASLISESRTAAQRKRPYEMPTTVIGPASFRRGTTQRLNEVINNFYDTVGVSEDLLGRVPVLSQAYAEEVVRLIPLMTRSARDEAVATLRRAGAIKQAKRVLQAGEPQGVLSADSVDLLAKQSASETVKNLFYDAHNRQNWAVAMRLFSPFAQATANSFRKYGELILKNPQYYYRASKGIQALQDPDSAVIYDALGRVTDNKVMQGMWNPQRPDLSAKGFFYINPDGQRMFAYPSIGGLNRLFLADGVLPGVSNQESLNVIGMTPNLGVGPFVTLAASLMPGNPINDDNFQGNTMRFLFPYGVTQEGSLWDKTFAALAPTFAKKLGTATDDQSTATKTMQIASSLLAEGGYDMDKPGEAARLMADASRVSTLTGLLDWIGSSITPSTQRTVATLPLSPEDREQFVMTTAVAQEYQRYIDSAPSVSEAQAAFLDDYGPGWLMSVLPKTSSKTGTPATNDIWSWETDHKAEYNDPDYRNAIQYFFAGSSFDRVAAGDTRDPNDFSPELWNQQKATGERSPVDLDSLVQDARDQMSWAAYNRRTQQIAESNATDGEKAAMKSLLKDDLQSRNPTWDPAAASSDVSIKSNIAAITKALQNPAFSDLDSAPYLEQYLAEREKVRQTLRAHGLSGDTLKTTSDHGPVRAASDYLTRIGMGLVAADPTGAFANSWNRLFAREVGAV